MRPSFFSDKRRNPVSVLVAAAAFAVLVMLPALAAGQVRVQVRPDSTVEGDRVTIADVAVVSGEPAATERLRSVSLGYAPNIGMSREIRREQIAMALKAAGLFDGTMLESPASLVVRRAGQELSSDIVRAEIERALLTGLLAEGADAKLVRMDMPSAIRVPVGQIELRANSTGARSLFAPFPVPVEVRINGKLVRTFAVTAEVEAYADVLVAGKDLAAGNPLGTEECRSGRTRLTRSLSSYVRTLASLRGTALVREVRSGEPITRDMLASVSVIKPGDAVKIEAGIGQLKIVTAGEARAAGRIGDRISVKNITSGTLLQAVVVDKGVVRVAL